MSVMIGKKIWDGLPKRCRNHDPNQVCPYLWIPETGIGYTSGQLSNGETLEYLHLVEHLEKARPRATRPEEPENWLPQGN